MTRNNNPYQPTHTHSASLLPDPTLVSVAVVYRTGAQTQIHALNTQLAELQAMLNRRNQENAALAESNAQLTRENQRLQTALAQLEINLRLSNQEKLVLTRSNTRLAQETQDLRAAQAAAMRLLHEKDARIAQLAPAEAAAQRLREECRDLNARIQQLQNEKAIMQQEKDALMQAAFMCAQENQKLIELLQKQLQSFAPPVLFTTPARPVRITVTGQPTFFHAVGTALHPTPLLQQNRP